jgi:hypothetical protein
VHGATARGTTLPIDYDAVQRLANSVGDAADKFKTLRPPSDGLQVRDDGAQSLSLLAQDLKKSAASVKTVRDELGGGSRESARLDEVQGETTFRDAATDVLTWQSAAMQYGFAQCPRAPTSAAAAAGVATPTTAPSFAAGIAGRKVTEDFRTYGNLETAAATLDTVQVPSAASTINGSITDTPGFDGQVGYSLSGTTMATLKSFFTSVLPKAGWKADAPHPVADGSTIEADRPSSGCPHCSWHLTVTYGPLTPGSTAIEIDVRLREVIG